MLTEQPDPEAAEPDLQEIFESVENHLRGLPQALSCGRRLFGLTILAGYQVQLGWYREHFGDRMWR